MQSLDAAQLLLNSGHADFAAARAYYAAFYAACAVLLSENKDFSKHSGVLSAIHRDFIRNGRLSEEQGKALDWLFELRGIGDYGATRHVPEDQAKDAIPAAERFVEACGELLREKGLRFQ